MFAYEIYHFHFYYNHLSIATLYQVVYGVCVCVYGEGGYNELYLIIRTVW